MKSNNNSVLCLMQELADTVSNMGDRIPAPRRNLQQQRAVSECKLTPNNKRRSNLIKARSSSSVSSLAFASTDTSMAPLQCHATATRSATCLNYNNSSNHHNNNNNSSNSNNNLGAELNASSQTRSNNQREYNPTTEENNSSSNTENEAKNLRKTETRSFISLINRDNSSTRSISPVVLGRQNSLNTVKNEQQPATATSSTSATTAMSSTSEKKEKKRKEISGSRVKKFHRHFPQIGKDEKLINYFSCALVSDILLQGHLYITDTHFAFYSNVFGYVTRVVIPTSSVTRVSKEKTAKIIPNAVGVATSDERHVFGSFISREAAFRLMCSVCPQMAPIEFVPPPTQADAEVFEEYSIEDDSSCSISGNESLPLLLEANFTTADNLLLKRSVTSIDSNAKDIPKNAKSTTTTNSSMASSQTSTNTSGSTGVGASVKMPVLIIAGSVSSSNTSLASTPTPSTSSAPTTVVTPKKQSAAQSAFTHIQRLAKQIGLRLKFPTEVHVVYLGVLLTLVLAMFSIFLLYRILDIETKASIYHSTADFDWRSVNDDDILVEALRWQKQLQEKSAEEAQHILNTNLEQIGKVRRSLETLSMLIQERSASKESD